MLGKCGTEGDFAAVNVVAALRPQRPENVSAFVVGVENLTWKALVLNEWRSRSAGTTRIIRGQTSKDSARQDSDSWLSDRRIEQWQAPQRSQSRRWPGSNAFADQGYASGSTASPKTAPSLLRPPQCSWPVRAFEHGDSLRRAAAKEQDCRPCAVLQHGRDHGQNRNHEQHMKHVAGVPGREPVRGLVQFHRTPAHSLMYRACHPSGELEERRIESPSPGIDERSGGGGQEPWNLPLQPL